MPLQFFIRQVWTSSSINVFIKERKSVKILSRYLVNKEGYYFNTKPSIFRKAVGFPFLAIYLKLIDVLIKTVYWNIFLK